jgi:hypothetical protein
MKCCSRSVSPRKKFNASIESSVQQNISECGDTQLTSISSIAENVFDGSKLMGHIITRTNSLTPRSMIPTTGSRGNLQENTGINPKNFRPEYCFHKITGITRHRQFPGRVVRPGQKKQQRLHLKNQQSLHKKKQWQHQSAQPSHRFLCIYCT